MRYKFEQKTKGEEKKKMVKSGSKRNLTGLMLAAVLAFMMISAPVLGEEASANPASEDTETSLDNESNVDGNGVTLEFMGTVEAEFPVHGTNLLYHRTEIGNCELINVEGDPLTEAIYTGEFSFSNGYITCEENIDSSHNKGLLSIDGTMLIPCQYVDLDVYPKWAVGFIASDASADRYDIQSIYDDFFLIDTVDIYYLGGEEPDLVASLARDQYLDSYAWGDYINIQDRTTNEITAYDPTFTAVQTGENSVYSFGSLQVEDYIIFEDNGREGVKDLDGNILIPADYKCVMEFYGELAQVTDGDMYGILDANGVVVPVEYDNIEVNWYAPIVDGDSRSYEANGYFAVIQDGKLGYVAWGGEETFAPTYAQDALDICGAASLMTSPDGTFSLIAADGTETVLPEEYSYVTPIKYSSGMLWNARIEDGSSVVIDWHGEQVIPDEFYGNSIEMTGDGQYLLACEEDHLLEEYQVYHVVYEEAEDVTRGEAEEVDEEIAETEGIEPVGETEEMLSDEENQQTEAMPESDEGSQEAVTLLDSAYSLLNENFETGKSSAGILLTQAASLIEDTYPETAAIIESANSLLKSDTADFGTIGILIESARDMLMDEESN